MTAEATAVSLDAIDAALTTATPGLGEDEQRLAAAVLRLLSAGESACIAAAAAAAGMPVPRAGLTLRSWPAVFWDGRGRVTGFWGLALAEMPYRICHAGIGLHAWCAWDPLFLARGHRRPAGRHRGPGHRRGHHLPHRRRRHHLRRLAPARGAVVPATRSALGRRRDNQLLPPLGP